MNPDPRNNDYMLDPEYYQKYYHAAGGGRSFYPYIIVMTVIYVAAAVGLVVAFFKMAGYAMFYTYG